MLKYIVNKYRYVVNQGVFKTPERLKYTTDNFTTKPVPHLKIFELNEENLTIIS